MNNLPAARINNTLNYLALEFNNDSIWLLIPDHITGKMAYNDVKHLDEKDPSYPLKINSIFDRVKKQIKNDSNFEKCLQNKSSLITKKLQGKIISPLNQHLPIYQIFVNWVFDLVDLYKVNFPENLQTAKMKEKLLQAMAEWRYDLKNAVKEKNVLDQVTELESNLRDVYPDLSNFSSPWNALKDLLMDNSNSKLFQWDPDIPPWTLLNREKPFPKLKSGIKIDSAYAQRIPVKDFEQMWKYTCLVTKEMWHTIIPIVESKKKTTGEIISRQSQQMSEGEQKLLEHSLNKDKSLEFIDRWKNKIYEILNQLSKDSLSNPKNIAKEIDQIQQVILTFEEPNLFPLITVDENVLQQIKLTMIHHGIEPNNLLKLTKFNIMQSNICHKLMDMVVGTMFNNIVEFWSAASINKDLTEKDLLAQGAGEELIKSDEMEQNQHSKKSKRQNKKTINGKKTLTTKREDINIQNKLETNTPVPSVSSKNVEKDKVAIGSISEHPFKSTLSKGSTYSIAIKAAHADLSYCFLKAATLIFDEYSNTSRHSFNLQKLSLNTMQSLLEQALSYVNMKQGADAKELNHNLWTLFHNSKLNLQNKPIIELYSVSFWSRFMREQHHEWSSLQARGQKMPKVLQELFTLSNNPTQEQIREIQASTKRRITDVHKLTTDISSILNHSDEPIGKFPSIENNLTKLPSYKINEIPVFDVLMKRIDNLHIALKSNPDSQIFLWIQQWQDDLHCLLSTLEIIHLVTCPKQYALLVNHFHGLLHGVIQSPLYALQVIKNGEHEHGHNLTDMWKNVDEKMQSSTHEDLEYWLHNASISSRYPFECSSPQSEMHRIQLEAISHILAPELFDGFQIAKKQKEESSFNTNGTWLPELKVFRSIEEQRKALCCGFEKISTILLEKMYPLLEKDILIL